MSPERIHEKGYSFGSDIWSLGCLLYEVREREREVGRGSENVSECYDIDGSSPVSILWGQDEPLLSM